MEDKDTNSHMEEAAHLHKVYAMSKLQDYIKQTTVLTPNGHPVKFTGVPWPLLHRQLPVLHRFAQE
jgi:hypothetical protein